MEVFKAACSQLEKEGFQASVNCSLFFAISAQQAHDSNHVLFSAVIRNLAKHLVSQIPYESGLWRAWHFQLIVPLAGSLNRRRCSAVCLNHHKFQSLGVHTVLGSAPEPCCARVQGLWPSRRL